MENTFVVNDEDWVIAIGERAVGPVEEHAARLLRTSRSTLERLATWVGARAQRHPHRAAAPVPVDRQQPRAAADTVLRAAVRGQRVTVPVDAR